MKAEEALLAIAKDAKVAIRLLAEASPSAELANLRATALELVLASLGTNLAAAGADPSIPTSSRAALAGAASEIARLQKATLDVRSFLQDLSVDWRCGSCRGRVVAAAAIGPELTNESVLLVCERCGAETAPTERGRAMFAKIFGLTRAPGFDPKAHGFRSRA